MTRRLIRQLMRPGDLWAIVSTGTSSVSQPLTSDHSEILAASRRITGNRLPYGALSPQFGPSEVTEVRHRTGVAYATAVGAIENMSRLPRRQIVVFYFSGGYDLESVPEPTPVISAAWRAQATIHSFHIRELIEQMPAPPSGVNAASWSTYERITMDSLRLLATRTGGVPIESNEELETALGQLLP